MTDGSSRSNPPPLGTAQTRELKTFLESETATLESVLLAIEEEHAALREADAEAIEAAAAAKNRALSGHAEQQHRRHDWVQQQALATTMPLATLVGAATGAGLDGLTERLGELARACDAGNRRNGALIQRLQERTRSALGVLRGSGDKGDVYSGSGGQEHGSDRRSLGKA